MRSAFFCSFFFMLVSLSSLVADDWPQWLGPKRDGGWREEGILDRFPDAGLAVQWRTPIALGYAGPAVSDGRVYVMDYVRRSGKVTNNPGGVDKLQGTERVLCLDAETGQIQWKHEYERAYEFSYGGGPRCTPAIDEGKVYALGAEGNLWCLDAEDGHVIWSKDFVAEYGAKTPFWGVAAHPLVVGDKLFCIVGGEGSVAVAFEKNSGEEIWRALSASQQGYCPPTIVEYGGSNQLLVWHSESINSLDPDSGKLNWSVPLKPSFGMAITAPTQIGPFVFVSGYGDVGVLLELADDCSKPKILWRGTPRTAVYCANSTPTLEDNMIYGCDISTGALMGVRLRDGDRLWQTMEPTTGGDRRARYGTAFLVKHRDRSFLFSETGDLILAKLSPQGYEELDRAHVLEPTGQTFGRAVVWSYPAFAERSMFARNDQEIVRVSLAAE